MCVYIYIYIICVYTYIYIYIYTHTHFVCSCIRRRQAKALARQAAGHRSLDDLSSTSASDSDKNLDRLAAPLSALARLTLTPRHFPSQDPLRHGLRDPLALVLNQRVGNSSTKEGGTEEKESPCTHSAGGTPRGD